MITRSLLVGVSLGLCALAPANAAPAAIDDVAKTAVFFSDLNTANPEDAAVLYKRVRRAALQVCGDSPGVRGLEAARQTRRCVDAAVAQAVDDLNAPLVTALHDDRQRPRTFGFRQALRLRSRN